MRLDKAAALKLRKSGKSYNQIHNFLNIPKSTLSTWLKDVPLSRKARNKIQTRASALAISKLIERNKQQTILAEQRHQQIYRQAQKEAKKFLNTPLFLTGISLYWAEGYKKGAMGSKWKSVDFANSDPQMIKLMILFFIKFLKIKLTEINVQIMLHTPKANNQAINFWKKTTGIPRQNFINSCYVISKASLQKRNKTLKYGTIHLRINNVVYFFRIIGWIEALKQKFKINRGVAQLV